MFYWFIKGMFWPLGQIYFRMRRRGLEHLPARGPVILVANHSSYLDPPALGSASPRKVHFLINRSVYRLARFRWFYIGMEAIPVSAERQDALSLRQAMRVLSRGEVVGVFPEGGRNLDGRVGTPRLGAALLAARSGAPVVPAGIRGAYQALPPTSMFPKPHRIEVVFGAPLRWEEGHAERQKLEEFSRRMMGAVSNLLDGGH
ncbi:MAG: lysophospholipid acyltransferase family protein [Acidobacteriota bacterium]